MSEFQADPAPPQQLAKDTRLSRKVVPGIYWEGYSEMCSVKVQTLAA